MSYKSIGIIGYGNFGKLLAAELSAQFSEVLVSDKDTLGGLPSRIKQVEISQIANQDLIIIATPISALPGVLDQLAEHIKSGSTIIDVCSVKIRPIELMKKLLPENVNIIATHPLFGPQSINDRDNLNVVVIEVRGDTKQLESLFLSLGWKVKKVSADEHDKQMAAVQGLTFFISQALIEMNIEEPDLPTGSYKLLKQLNEIQSAHTRDLTDTIEGYNPYADKIRRQFIDKAIEIDRAFLEIDQ